MSEPHHVAVELDQVVEAARAEGDPWREFLRAGMFSAGVYRLTAGEIDPQTPHAEDEIYYVLAGRAELEVEGKRHAVLAETRDGATVGPCRPGTTSAGSRSRCRRRARS